MIWIPIVLSLALYFVPAALFRRSRYRFSRDYLVSANGTSDDVFQNSSIAYAIQLATFGPFFVWGLTGDWIPGVLNSTFYCLGLALLFFFRTRIANFLRLELAGDRSITIHEFLARSHGGSSWIRVVASGLTIVALCGIVMAEVFGILSVVGPLLNIGSTGSYLFVVSLFFLMFIYSTLGGNDGVMRMDQLQLGIGYIGVFVAVAGMIFLLYQTGTIGATRGAISIVYFGAFGVIWLVARRFRFVESTHNSAATPSAWQGYLHVECIVGKLVVLAFVLMVAAAVGFAVMAGPHNLVDAFNRSVTTSTGMSGLALFALALLPLGYQVVDITNWQRFAAAGNPASYGDGPTRRALLQYVAEAPLVWVALLAFGALAGALFVDLPESSNPFGDYAAHLMNRGDLLGTVTVTAFLVAVIAIGLSTMDAVFSATQCAFQYDLLPALSKEDGETSTTRKIRITRIFGLAAYLAVIGMLYIVEKYLSFGRDNYLAVLLAFYSAQMAFVPLVIGAFISTRRHDGQSPVTPIFASAALIAGAAVGIGATVSAVVADTGDLFLWGSIPACLLVSSIIYVIGWHLGRSDTRYVDKVA